MLGEAEGRPGALLSLLQQLLGGIAGTGAPTLLASPSAFAAMRGLALLAGARYQQAIGGAHPSQNVCSSSPSGCKHSRPDMKDSFEHFQLIASPLS